MYILDVFVMYFYRNYFGYLDDSLFVSTVAAAVLIYEKSIQTLNMSLLRWTNDKYVM